MYNMYPNYKEAQEMSERGVGGLGHPNNYPVEQSTPEATSETVRLNFPRVDQAVGHVTVAELVDE